MDQDRSFDTVVPNDRLGGAERQRKHRVGNERLKRLNSKGD